MAMTRAYNDIAVNHYWNILQSVDDNIKIQLLTKLSDSLAESKTNNNYFLVDDEAYIYGKIRIGESDSEILMYSDDDDVYELTIPTEFEVVIKYKLNQTIGIHIKCKRRSNNGAIDRDSIQIIGFVEYNSDMRDEYLNNLRKNVSSSWNDIKNPEQWLHELREIDYENYGVI